MTDEIPVTSPRIDSRRTTVFALHALFIGIIFVLPEALLRVAIPDRTLEISWPMYVKSCITIGVFYLNYFIIIPRTMLISRRRWQFFVWNVILIIAGAVAIWVIYRFLFTGPRLHRLAPPLASLSYILRDAIMLILSCSLAVALRMSSRWLELERRHQKLLAVRKQTELDSLRSQLNPHFLFNTLNTIYALIAVSPPEAQKAVHQLSSLLRYVVYDNPRVVPLDREVEFVVNYVELMRLRMWQRPVILTVERHNDASVEIAPLLFITLVENAFKHGNTEDSSLPIKISILSDGHTITCSTENYTDGAAVAVKSAKGGVGLVNLRRRIELLYGTKASLTSGLVSDGIYKSTLTLTPNS